MNKSAFLSILIIISADIYGMIGFSEYIDSYATPKNTLTKEIKVQYKNEQEKFTKGSKVTKQSVKKNNDPYKIFSPKTIRNSTKECFKQEVIEKADPTIVQVTENQNNSIFCTTSVSEKPVAKKDQGNENKKKELEKVKKLLKNTHPDRIIKNNESLIINAVRKENIDLVKLLLQYGANPNQLNWAGLSLLSIAYINRDWDMVRLFLDHGVHPDDTSIFCCSLFFIAYAENKLDMTELLLQHGANPNQKGWLGNYSILVDAVQGDNFEMVKLLLKYGADPNQIDIYNKTPTFIAAERKNSKLVKLLLNYGGRFHLLRMSRY